MTSSYINLLQAYFDLSYFLFTTPFRYISNKKPKSTCHISKWLPQQIICAIVGVLGYIMDIYNYRVLYQIARKQLSRDPVLYFGLLSIIFGSALQLSAHKLFWHSAVRITKIFSFLESNSPSIPPSITSFSKLKCNLITLLITVPMWYQVIYFICQFFDPEEIPKLLEVAHDLFFFVDFSNSTTDNLNGTKFIFYSDLEYALLTLVAVVWTVKRVSVLLIGLGILYPVIILWLASKAFRKKLKDTYNKVEASCLGTQKPLQLNDVLFLVKSKHQNHERYCNNQWIEIWKSYQTIQELAQLSSNAFGSMLTWYFAQFIMSLSRNIDTLIFAKGLQGKLDMLQFLAISMAIFILSAEVVVNVCGIHEYLFKYIKSK